MPRSVTSGGTRGGAGAGSAQEEELALSQAQAAAIEKIYSAMRFAAIAEGERSRTALRFIHLSALLEMPKILRAKRIHRYNRLLGYRGY